MDETHLELGEATRAVIREMAREIAKEVIHEHAESCPASRLEPRVRKLEMRFTAFAALAVGSGLFGGTSAVLLNRLLGG